MRFNILLILEIMLIPFVYSKCSIGDYSGKYKLGRYPDMYTTCNNGNRFECLISNYGKFDCGYKIYHRDFLLNLYRVKDSNIWKYECDSAITQYKNRKELGMVLFDGLLQSCHKLIQSVQKSMTHESDSFCEYSLVFKGNDGTVYYLYEEKYWIQYPDKYIYN